jgi:hypothetical protein
MKEAFVNITHSSFAISILDNLFKKLIISTGKLARNSNINNQKTSSDLLKITKQ